MGILERFLYWTTDRLPARFIDSKGKPYLERYYLCTIPWTQYRFFIHHFVNSDPDRGLHNHPWLWALSWILVGGYTELKLLERANGQQIVTEVERRSGRFNLIKGKDFHRVLIAHTKKSNGVWTLFFHGPRTKNKGWGFLEYMLELNDNRTCATLVESSYNQVDMKKERDKNEHWWLRNSKGKEARAARK